MIGMLYVFFRSVNESQRQHDEWMKEFFQRMQKQAQDYKYSDKESKIQRLVDHGATPGERAAAAAALRRFRNKRG